MAGPIRLFNYDEMLDQRLNSFHQQIMRDRRIMN